MSAITTSAPARASVSASARPRPREPPVTNATRPLRSISMLTPGEPTRRSVARDEDLLRDHEPLDLRRALVDLEELRVAHELLDRVLLHVPVTAEDLHCVRRHLHRGIGGEAFCERRVERRALALVEHPRRLPCQQ